MAGEDGKHIALIGLSGAGKSTVGPLAARALGLPFVDTDRMIEAQAGAPISAIFAERGEAAFRRLEAEVVRRTLSGPRAVVSLGGGAILDAESRRLVWERAVVVWLRADPGVLARRLAAASGEERPLLAGDREGRLRALLREREAVYACAHVRIDTTDTPPKEVAARVLQALGRREEPA